MHRCEGMVRSLAVTGRASSHASDPTRMKSWKAMDRSRQMSELEAWAVINFQSDGDLSTRTEGRRGWVPSRSGWKGCKDRERWDGGRGFGDWSDKVWRCLGWRFGLLSTFDAMYLYITSSCHFLESLMLVIDHNERRLKSQRQIAHP